MHKHARRIHLIVQIMQWFYFTYFFIPQKWIPGYAAEMDCQKPHTHMNAHLNPYAFNVTFTVAGNMLPGCISLIL